MADNYHYLANLAGIVRRACIDYIDQHKEDFRSTVKGDRGEQGDAGSPGPDGRGIDHICFTSTSDPLGRQGISGYEDAYSIYADNTEEQLLGYFIVHNGRDSLIDSEGRLRVENSTEINGNFDLKGLWAYLQIDEFAMTPPWFTGNAYDNNNVPFTEGGLRFGDSDVWDEFPIRLTYKKADDVWYVTQAGVDTPIATLSGDAYVDNGVAWFSKDELKLKRLEGEGIVYQDQRNGDTEVKVVSDRDAQSMFLVEKDDNSGLEFRPLRDKEILDAIDGTFRNEVNSTDPSVWESKAEQFLAVKDDGSGAGFRKLRAAEVVKTLSDESVTDTLLTDVEFAVDQTDDNKTKATLTILDTPSGDLTNPPTTHQETIEVPIALAENTTPGIVQGTANGGGADEATFGFVSAGSGVLQVNQKERIVRFKNPSIDDYDIALPVNAKILGTDNDDNQEHEILGLNKYGAGEYQTEVGSPEAPICFNYAQVANWAEDIHPKATYKDLNGQSHDERLAFVSELDAYSAETNTRLNELAGRGGPLTANDFGSQTPSQEALIEYAMRTIFLNTGDTGVFTWDSVEPANSILEITRVDSSTATRAASEIFNATWVRNTNGGTDHRWVLVNTPDTIPAVFAWIDAGQDVVAEATADVAGVVTLNQIASIVSGSEISLTQTSFIHIVSELPATPIANHLYFVTGS